MGRVHIRPAQAASAPLKALVPVTGSGFLQGGGSMGAAMRGHIWAATPLGPASAWPQSLRSALSICLNSPFPTAIYWGPELRVFHNDAWSAFLSGRRVQALGRPAREVWSEIWDVVGPQLARVVATGEAVSAQDFMLRLERGGRPEDTWWTYCLTPIRGEDGQVAGAFNSATETTAAVRTRRRMRFRLELEDRLRDVADARGAMAAAAGALGRHFGAARAGYAEMEADDAHARVEDDWCAEGVPSIRGRHRLDAYGPVFVAGYRAGRAAVVEDMETDPRSAGLPAANAHAAIAVRAQMVIPLVVAGRLVAMFFVHAAEPRRWSEEDVTAVHEVAERTWAAVARARVEAALRGSERRLKATHDNAGVGTQEVDAEGRYISVNETFRRMTGYGLEDFAGLSFFDIIEDEGERRRAHEAYPALVRGDLDTIASERRCTDKHGRIWWAEVRTTAVRDEEGRFLHAVRVVQDVTERKLAAERQAMLAREVDHRAKNVLAVVQAALRLTRAGDLPGFVKAVEGRVGALARAQTLLSRERWAGADLRELLRGELAVFPDGAERAALDGPPVALPVEVAQPLSMAVHELATNAVKHGALSVPDGRVSVTWRRDPEGGLRLRWAESGGPPVPGPPSRRGFGSRVLEGTLGKQLGGAVRLAWLPAGLACEMEVPLRAGAAKRVR